MTASKAGFFIIESTRPISRGRKKEEEKKENERKENISIFIKGKRLKYAHGHGALFKRRENDLNTNERE